MFAEWEDGERFSFEDSDRFEEDSLCSFISEAESLCQNWRGWRKQSAGPNSPTVKIKDGQVIPLVELSAKQVAFHIPFEVVEKVYPPEQQQRRTFAELVLQEAGLGPRRLQPLEDGLAVFEHPAADGLRREVAFPSRENLTMGGGEKEEEAVANTSVHVPNDDGEDAGVSAPLTRDELNLLER
ncbi:Zinc finger SWIM domain-containing protein 8 [Liparis tanakae]|uniref:Zinc finger SWIM domain-containing protein 8 n=1 Tax=Liparis tanakae TaxID=230148 RepID=A0A4Z2GB97_9TELE|nr:Zinc finger SWIM domain-containing protein 8 [Liparis tanakae]